MDEVTIILNTPDAILFRDYQKFHATFALMVKAGVFDVKHGKVIIHFDTNGNIQKIERNDDLFDSRIK